MTQTAAICPACVSLPEAPLQAAAASGGQAIILSLPAIHCAACMVGVERALLALEAVNSARVNLSLKRVTITTRAAIETEALIDTLAQAGFTARALDSTLLGPQSDQVGRVLLTRIAVAGFAMMNVTLLSVAVWSGAIGATRTMFHLISASIALPALIYAGQPFFRNALQALAAWRLNMDVPISLAILLAGGMSAYETLLGGAQAYFDAALSLTFFLLIGRYLDHRSRSAAQSAARQLAALEVPRVLRQTGRTRQMVDPSDLRIGDLVVVLPGGRIPVDGIVHDGSSQIDRSLLTGESQPLNAQTGSTVTAGEVNMTGPLTICATAVGDDTTLRKMVTMVDAAETARNRYTALADRAAAIYAPVVHVLALAAFVAWFAGSGDARLALNIAIAVLIITCPCALGLAVPAVSTAAAGILFRAGILVKNGTALERMAEVDTVVFDKTGTLTVPAALHELPGLSHAAVALGLSRNSNHPVSCAITAHLTAAGVTPADLSDISEHTGLGINGIWQGQQVRLGSGSWMDHAAGTYLQIGSAPPQPIALQDALREGAAALVAAWRAKGLHVHLLSGDGAALTAQTAALLGITDWQAETSPAGKIAYLTQLADKGAKVLMVGDGLNDTGALAAAHVSLAPAAAADASRSASDMVLLRDDLATLTGLPDIARAARRRAIENFAIAAVYNAVAIPVALAGLATPLLAAIAMSASSITVLLNALRLRGGRT